MNTVVNNEQQQRLLYLLGVYADDMATPEEIAEMLLLNAQPACEGVLAHYMEQLRSRLPGDQEKQWEADWEKIWQNIQVQKKEPFKRTVVLWQRMAVAASVVIILAIAGYFMLYNEQPETGKKALQQLIVTDVEAPGNNRATIMLADGRLVYLDSAGSGQLAQQGGVQLIKLADGQIAYRTATGEIISELQYNTLNNPRGSKVIDMQLADGSRVWLNAGSSVTYPVVFVGNERKVQITGEAYFEIAPDKTKPFKVSKGGVQVQVLGTSFNVNAYDDEPGIKVTLLEGAVKISNRGDSRQIQPGQQATIHHSSFLINNYVNIDQVMAWKNGLFNFSGLSFNEVMRQVSRWYDIKVVTDPSVPAIQLKGKMDQGVKLSGFTRFLADYGLVTRLENKTLYINVK